jgi:hypothetical protein
VHDSSWTLSVVLVSFIYFPLVLVFDEVIDFIADLGGGIVETRLFKN